MKKIIYDNVGKVFLNMNIAMISENETERYIILDNSQISRYETQKSEIEAETRASYDLQYIITGVATPEPTKSLEQLKDEKKQAILSVFASLDSIKNGFKFTIITDENPEGIEKTWNFDENTITNIVQQKVGYDEIPEVNELKITDRYKVQQTLNRTEFRNFIKEYFLIIHPLKSKLSDKNNKVELAQSESDLNAINMEF